MKDSFYIGATQENIEELMMRIPKFRSLIKEIVNADWEKAMTRLHSEPENTSRLL